MKKQSNPQPPPGSMPPPPPPSPEGLPSRTFKETLFSGLVETKESKQSTRDWENYIRGYRAGLVSRSAIQSSNDGIQCGDPNIDTPARSFADAVMPDKPWPRSESKGPIGAVVIYTTLRNMLKDGFVK